MAGLLAIPPSSNADSERGFSILRKIHTDQRSNLDQSTVVALMSLKFNCDDCCHEVQFEPELLTVVWVWHSVPEVRFEKLATMSFPS